MKRITVFTFLFFSISFFFGQMNPEKWKEDINFLRENLSKKHCNLFFKRDKVLFDRDLDNLVSQTSNLSDLEIALKLQQIIAKQGDTHTNISWGKYLNNDKTLPLRYFYFEDGIHVTLTNQENKELLGKKILKINGFDVKQVTDSISSLFVNENKGIYKSKALTGLSSIQILKFFGFAKNDSIKITFQNDSLLTEKLIFPKEMKDDERVKISPQNLTFIRENKNKIFEKKYFEKEKILYVLYNSCVSKEEPSIYKGKPEEITLPSFLEFQNEVKKMLNDNPVEKLIFDMRLNSGGSYKQGDNFIREVVINSKIDKKGKLFVLIGRDTFSAAILNSRFFQENTKAIFVGEETMGKPNHYGFLNYFNLNNSKIEVSYSTEIVLTTKKKNQETMKPDYNVEETFEDYKNGIDPVFEFVKNYK